jgi:hypothetical protein
MSSKLPALANTPTPLATDLMYLVRVALGAAGSLNATLADLRAFLLAGVPQRIETNITPAQNTGAGLDPLHTFTLLAGTLSAAEDSLDVLYCGTFATNDNDKRIVITLDGQTVTTIGTGAFDQDSGSWSYRITYTRLTATSVLAKIDFNWGFMTRDGAGAMVGNGITATATATITVADLDANSVILLVSAEGVANADIIQLLSEINLTVN